MCQVEKEGKGMSGRGSSIGKGTEASCRPQSGKDGSTSRKGPGHEDPPSQAQELGFGPGGMGSHRRVLSKAGT